MWPICDASMSSQSMVTFFFFWGIYYHEHKILCAYCLSDTAKLYPHLLMGVNYNYFSTAQLTMEM